MIAGGSPWLVDQAVCVPAPSAPCKAQLCILGFSRLKEAATEGTGEGREDQALHFSLLCVVTAARRCAGAQQDRGDNPTAYLSPGGGVRANDWLRS